MKKILMVTETMGSGVFAYVSQLCNDMCDDFDVYLAYSDKRTETPKNFRDFLNPKVNLVEVSHFGSNSLMNVINDYKIIKELRNIEKEIQPDIIHLHSSVAGGLGRLAFKGKNNVVLYTPHGYAHILMGPGLKSKILQSIEWLLGRGNSITLTCCESEDKVASKLARKTAYIETGLSINVMQSLLDKVKPEKNEKFTVFSLGRICKQKRPDLFNQIAEMVPDAQFIWIGDGPLRSELTAANLEVTGWKSRQEALAIAMGADVFILCSYGEAIAMSLLENMFMKKLCIVSETMGNVSVIKDGKNGYVCLEAADYAMRVKEAMQEFPEDISEQAYRDILTVYNTEVMKSKYIEYYNQLIRGGYYLNSIYIFLYNAVTAREAVAA